MTYWPCKHKKYEWEHEFLKDLNDYCLELSKFINIHVLSNNVYIYALYKYTLKIES